VVGANYKVEPLVVGNALTKADPKLSSPILAQASKQRTQKAVHPGSCVDCARVCELAPGSSRLLVDVTWHADGDTSKTEVGMN